MASQIPPRAHGISWVRAELSAVPRSVTTPLLQYIHAEQAGGIMLMLGGIIGLAWANSPWAHSYQAAWHHDLRILFIHDTAQHWVNDGLMVFFFLLIGLEIKRELIVGELSSFRKAALPAAAALGGMVLPAGIYLLLNRGESTAHGWGVPVATDIAFALGILALLGERIPYALKVFLLALATVDDIGGVLIIALVYTHSVSWLALIIAAAIIAAIIGLRRLHVTHAGIYGLLGVALWIAILKSGVHATIAGVILGLLSPVHPYYGRHDFVDKARELLDEIRKAVNRDDEEAAEMRLGQLEELTRDTERRAERLERLLRPWVSYLVLPVFAIANTGVVISGSAVEQVVSSPVAQGIMAGLLIGKFLGIAGGAWLVTRFGLSRLPHGVNWHHVLGAAILAGIGFTVSLFIAQLAFRGQTAVVPAKLAVLASSVVAGIAGALFLLLATRRSDVEPVNTSRGP